MNIEMRYTLVLKLKCVYRLVVYLSIVIFTILIRLRSYINYNYLKDC